MKPTKLACAEINISGIPEINHYFCDFAGFIICNVKHLGGKK